MFDEFTEYTIILARSDDPSDFKTGLFTTARRRGHSPAEALRFYLDSIEGAVWNFKVAIVTNGSYTSVFDIAPPVQPAYQITERF